jgi:hypothetical protein
MNTLTVSVLELDKDKQIYRAVMWNGIVTTHHKSAIFTAAYAHANFFKTVKDLKAAVVEWAVRKKIAHIGGIHDGAACWPLHPDIWFLAAISRTQEIVSDGKFLACCAARLPDQTLMAHLFRHGPSFPNGVVKASFPFSTHGKNLFYVAEKLYSTGLEVFASEKLENVRGIHDEGQCWPDDF